MSRDVYSDNTLQCNSHLLQHGFTNSIHATSYDKIEMSASDIGILTSSVIEPVKSGHGMHRGPVTPSPTTHDNSTASFKH